MDYQFHDTANIFPLMTNDDFDALVEDIRKNGLLEPVELLDGKILDGRNRYRACLLAGVSPRFTRYDGNDPVGYVLSKNLHRRHLSETQLGLAAAKAEKVRDAYSEQNRKRIQDGAKHGGHAKAGTCPPVNLPEGTKGETRDQIGKAFGISGKTADYGRKVLKDGSPEMIAAVERDEIAVSTAARQIGILESHEAQDEWLESAKGKKGSRKNETVEPEVATNGKPGVGVMKANEAINALSRIPKNDPLRKRGFQIVSDWIKTNR